MDDVPKQVNNSRVVLALEETLNGHIDDGADEISITGIALHTALVLGGLLLEEARDLVVGDGDEQIGDQVEGRQDVLVGDGSNVVVRDRVEDVVVDKEELGVDAVDARSDLGRLLNARSGGGDTPVTGDAVGVALNNLEEVTVVLLNARLVGGDLRLYGRE